MNTNLLDLDNDVLKIIGDYVKKDILEGKRKIKKKLMDEVQIINGIKIRFREFSYCTPNRLMMEEDYGPIKDKSTIPKDWIKSYIFHYVDNEIMYMKEIRRGKNSYIFNYVDDEIIKNNKIKLSRKDIRMCFWVGFQRCKIVLDYRGIYLNMEDDNNYLDEYLTFKKLNLKRKKYSFNY